MTEAEYDSWVEHEAEEYALEMAEASGSTLEEARRISREQTREFLPDGLRTRDAFLLRVLDGDGAPVGVLWVGPHPRRAGAGWVFDVEIEEARRGEGFGRAAMLAAEQVARDAGWTALGLNVFGTNDRARSLYDSLGYEVASTTMTKPLTP